MSTTSISFINRYPIVKAGPAVAVPVVGGKIIKPGRQEVEWVFAAVDFRLGLGPCGKVVTQLEVDFSGDLMGIFQRHEDGTTKEFIYQLSDIAGRIVIEDTGD